MRHWGLRRAGSVACAAWLALWAASGTLAVHESTNTLEFAPVAARPDATGRGVGTIDYRGVGTIDYRGGGATDSRWTATFRFEGLEPGTPYVVAVQGRYGEDGSPAASESTEICAFTTDSSGAGGCWYYFVVLIRLGIVQVRESELGGEVVLQATREEGPGTIISRPNRYSPPESPADAATPGATPAATPDAA